ncbi:Os01g0635800 [Oryza sativa Japonica Group]|uniref:Os01g0635800 protein n=1 Tax=Oryza sativa subsp. japonica TaxID=39947 RepID=A0A0P0V5R0_ORYSJ|nr:hypothetical protein EE612_004558 [Oryza sativa]BAS73334.1 Os01g0635800 [Oryza sativa Japonica Group]
MEMHGACTFIGWNSLLCLAFCVQNKRLGLLCGQEHCPDQLQPVLRTILGYHRACVFSSGVENFHYRDTRLYNDI